MTLTEVKAQIKELQVAIDHQSGTLSALNNGTFKGADAEVIAKLKAFNTRGLQLSQSKMAELQKEFETLTTEKKSEEVVSDKPAA